MYKPVQKPLEEVAIPELPDEPVQTDESQGGEYLDDAIRMTDQPLDQPTKPD
jgi:hypothetical protein